MLKVAICDDDVCVCTHIERTLNSYSKTYKIEFEFSVFYSGEKLCEFLLDNYYDIIFLDIELHRLNGIQVGKIIRNEMKNESTKIIYISHINDYAMELFDIRPFQYLIKPLNKEQLIQYFSLAVKMIMKDNEYFKYKINRTTQKKPIQDIICFETNNRKIGMITIEGKTSFYGKLDDVYKQIKDNCFLYIHRSYIVNYKYIDSIEYEQVTLSNQITLPISQKRRKEIRTQYLKFERNHHDNI